MANAKVTRRQKTQLKTAAIVETEEISRPSTGTGWAHKVEEPTNFADTTKDNQDVTQNARQAVGNRPESASVAVTVPLATTPSRGPNPATAKVSSRSPPSSSPERPIATTKMSSVRLFIASLGNPAPYQSTRHSAGHVMLRALQSHLQLPPLRKSKPYANGLLSSGADVGRPEYTLWQSPSYMNVSGKDLLKAYRQFIVAEGGNLSSSSSLPGLVVLHDEMETAPGQLRARAGNLSAKGHNGIKSVQQSLQTAGLLAKLTGDEGGGVRFIKIGVGVGRPAGGTRDKEEVSKYVLGNFNAAELAKLDSVASGLVQLLEEARAKMD